MLVIAVVAIAACAEQATRPIPETRGSPTPNRRNMTVRALRSSALMSGTGAVISNGTIQMGVNPEAHLNVPYYPDPLGIGYMGLRFLPTGAASTEPGCQCEGWGIGDVFTGVQGSANVSSQYPSVQNLEVVSFTSDATSATSVVIAAGVFKVTHEYKPSTLTNLLYEVNVTIENISSATVRPRYRRVMDWDIYPTPFNEFVTIQRGTATDIYRTDNNGFNEGNPFTFTSFGLQDVNFTDAGPNDHGALFDFQFADLAPGGKKSFRTYYGAAASEAGALGALGAVGAEAYSFGQPNVPGGPELGTPNTFIFAFGGIGGTPIVGNANAGPDQTLECGSSATLDGSRSSVSGASIVSYDWYEGSVKIASGVSPTVSLSGAGPHVIKLVVTDDTGATYEDFVTITIADGTPPAVTLSATESILWSPNHKYTLVAVNATVSDACDASVAIAGSVKSNEPDEDGTGDGNFTGDIRVTRADGTVLLSSNASPIVPFNPAAGDRLELRAERKGDGTGRVYTITFTATDAAGNATTRTAQVQVVHDQKK